MKATSLVCAVAFKNRLERFGDQLDVGAEVPVAHILVVQAHPFFKADVAAPADLPEARQARRYGKPHLVPGKVFLDFGRKRRAGPTTDMSPAKMLKSCGSSSRLNLRRMRPIG